VTLITHPRFASKNSDHRTFAAQHGGYHERKILTLTTKLRSRANP
jgi:hypothetical protein